MTVLYLSAVRLWLAAPQPLDSLPEFDDTEQRRAQYAELAVDFTAYRQADGPIWRSGAAAARATLAANPSARVDAVVYVSQNDLDTVSALPALLGDLSLEVGSVVAVSGHECANLGIALQTAADTITADRAETVLVVLADHAGAHGRLLDNGLSVFSDGAASFLLGRQRPAGAHFELLDVQVTRTPPGSDLLVTARSAQASVTETLRRCGLVPNDITAVAFANYRWDAQRFLAAAVRMSPEQVLRPDVADMAHCFSADVPVKLAGAQLAGGAVALGLVSGPWSWATIALRACAARP